MPAQAEWYDYAAPPLLAAALAEAVAQSLSQAIEENGRAVLAVSGGSTPAMFFRALAQKPLDWKSVIVTLVDERYVPPSSERSNERLVTLNLLQANAAAAQFVGLYSESDASSAAAVASERFADEIGSPDVVVLGMGLDGHTASIFPDAANLDALVDPAGSKPVLAVNSQTAGDPRLTLTMSAIARAGKTFVHIEGLAKKELLLAVLAGDQIAPIGAVINHMERPVDIYWAPGGSS